MPKKIKLLFRNRSLEMGGTENVLLTILHELDKSEYEITLLLNYHQGEFLNRVPKEVRVLSIGKGVDEFSNNKYLKLIQKSLRRLKYAWFQKFPKTFYQQHHLMDMDYEVAFSHYMYDDILNSPNRKSKKIFWFHGNLLEIALTNKEKKKVVDQFLKFGTGVFVSHFSKNIIEKTWNISLKNARVIHNPIPIEEMIQKSKEKLKTEEKFNFISVGRLNPAKGYKDLLYAHKKLIEEGYNIKTAIIGDGVEMKLLREMINTESLQSSFYLLGYQDNPIKYIRVSDVFVLPSYTESYPLVIVEALCAKVPIIATNVGGIPEMIEDRVHGILYEPDKDNLYSAMKELLTNHPLKESIITNNKVAICNFNPDKPMQEIYTIFK